jgi:hypothetical protein
MTNGLSDIFGGSAKAGDSSDPFAFLGTVDDPPAAPEPAPAEPASAPAPAPASVPPPTPRAPAPRTPAPPPPSRSVPAPSSPTAGSEEAPAQRAGGRPRRRRAKPAEPAEVRTDELDDVAEETTSQVQIYLKSWARKTAARLAKAEGLSNAQIAYDALDEARRANTLRALIEARRVDPRPADSAFPSRSTRRRPRHWADEGGARSLWSIQATPAERDVLERFVVEYGAESVSQLVSAAVEAYLEDNPLRFAEVDLKQAKRPTS